MQQFATRAVLALALMVAPAVASAQAGSIVGRLTESGTGQPVAEASVEAGLTGGPILSRTRTNENGEFRLANLLAGTYNVTGRRPGYQAQRAEGIVVGTGAVVTVNIEMPAQPTVLGEVTTTASFRQEKVLDAPASVTVVGEQEITERPSLTVADHIRSQPGVDVSSGGLVQSNIVARGFNNAFSGAMLVLQDNRFSAVPSLRVNVPLLFPSVNEDIERIEILLGPAAALYGPNSSSGVMHIITKSPFTSQGGTLTIDGGERSVLRGSGRYAAVLGERVGVKLSGEILRGRDWQYQDSFEPLEVGRPTGELMFRGGGTCPAPTEQTPVPDCVAVKDTIPNPRDFDIAKESGEFRIDLRPRPGMEWINTYGITHAGNYIEITGANGAAQARDWTYQTLQSRMTWNRTFAQVFYNTSDAGNKDSLDSRGTYLLRTGTPIVDKSRVFSAQIQQGIDFGQRQEFIVGADYIGTDPRTGGTINGRNEDIDDVTEVGGYVHSVTHLSPKFDFVAALRFDTHSEMDEDFWSPRAAIVYKITELQNLRLTYNRAFSTPANFSFFLDLPAGTLRGAGLPFDIRALGVPASGFTFGRDCGGGVGSLCMRSPFPVIGPNFTPIGAPNTRVAANAQPYYLTFMAGQLQALQLWGAGQGPAPIMVTALLNAGVAPGDLGAVLQAMAGANTSGVGTLLRILDPSAASPFGQVVGPEYVQDVEQLKASFNNVYEIGYKGILGSRLRLSVDAWYQERENFITPALNISPNAFLDPGAIATAGSLTQVIAGVLQQQAAAGRVPAGQVPGLIANFVTTLASVPFGTVVPDHALNDRPDIVFTYRNIDQSINLWGSDLAIDFSVTPTWSLIGTYSFINKMTFSEVLSGVDTLRLNAANHKGSLTTRYRSELSGWGAELRGRYVNAFPVNSGVYVGRVPVNAFLDASVSYRLPLVGRGAMISLSGTNILDNKRNSFIGVPEVGRMLMTRLQYTF